MTNTINSKKYDLEDRTAKFGEQTIKFCMGISKNEITRPLINQLIKCSTSIGANYCEADDAESKQDFRHKIGICKKESREAKHFLRMMLVVVPNLKDEIEVLWNEAKELNLIFNKIYQKVNK